MSTAITVSNGYVDVSIVDADVVVNFLSISVIVDIDSPIEIVLKAYVPMSSVPLYSFDLQQTLNAPSNKAQPEFNTTRF